jgi:hypothetical protein
MEESPMFEITVGGIVYAKEACPITWNKTAHEGGVSILKRATKKEPHLM